MKIRFIEQLIVRGQTRDEDIVYENGQVADFGKDPVANTYARAYIDRGHAVEHDETAIRAAEKSAREEHAKAEADAKAKAEAEAEADAKAKAEADAKARASQGGQQQSGQQSGR